jgi:hypothetical protein
MSCMGESLFIDCDGSVGLSLSNEKYIIILDQETWETRHRWNGSIKMNHKEIGCEGADWVHLA